MACLLGVNGHLITAMNLIPPINVGAKAGLFSPKTSCLRCGNCDGKTSPRTGPPNSVFRTPSRFPEKCTKLLLTQGHSSLLSRLALVMDFSSSGYLLIKQSDQPVLCWMAHSLN